VLDKEVTAKSTDARLVPLSEGGDGSSGSGDNKGVDGHFRHLLKSGRTEDVAIGWTWLCDQSFAQDQLAAQYLDYLLQHRESGEAAKVWASYLAVLRGDYPDRNLIVNGDFENQPTGAALDWRITAIPGVDAERDGHCARNGKYSLHIRFHGTDNVTYSDTARIVCVRPGEYRFRAYARSRELTTDEGIRFHIFDPESGRPMSGSLLAVLRESGKNSIQLNVVQDLNRVTLAVLYDLGTEQV